MDVPLRREWRPGRPVDLAGTLGPLRRGPYDPTYQSTPDGAVWRTVSTPDGPATQRLCITDAVVLGQAWGPGAGWVTERLPAALGADDDVSGFDASPHALVTRQWRRYGPGLRFAAIGRVFEMLVAAVIEQRVTSGEANRSWGWLVRRYGVPAPGPAPAGMAVCPPPEVWRQVPSWAWHRAGVETARSATVLRAAAVAHRLEDCTAMSGVDARTRLQLVRGVGRWTAAEVAQRALGDPDAVSYGDFHMAQNVVYALTGAAGGTDEQLAELLAPWAGHRGRVVRLVLLTGIARPPRGPRYTPLDFRTR